MKAIDIAATGMSAQNERLKIIAQNIANADSVATTPGGDPYQRKTISFKTIFDRALGADKVVVDRVGYDSAPFDKSYDPTHPAADEEGYVLRPNVNTLIEMTDMREAKASYQANLSVIEVTKNMVLRTLELLRV
ncbi:MAG: flagellar basal body rod protein FlgC [Alphaproteobacteria bacterium CG11_big_fil_rev_8_21_14_0_20_44_7]|nr:MAG: flagellar basal body rod protein FlgC [Alphaproteobacteria bacterium CG11_big_fil_rev_8_21_14_0_20_44_7]